MSEPPKSKGGRPKGSKTRPQWMRDELKKLPKRPRGRPPGAKNKPKTLEALIEQQLAAPPPETKPSGPPKRKRERQGYRGKPKEAYFARLKREDPEKLAEIGRKAALSAARAEKPRGRAGRPYETTNHEWAVRKEEARQLVHRIFTLMDKEGALPENPIAREAMKSAMQMLAEDNSSKDRLAVIRTLLEWNLAKPASTQNLNVKTAEDFLDDLAATDEG